MKAEMRSPDPHRDQNLNQLCNMMARILIRHEDSIQSIHSRDSFILFLNRGQQGIVQQLLQAGKDWKEESEPQKPLRACLMQTVMDQMTQRFSNFCTKLTDEAFTQASLDSNLLLPQGSMPYLMWDRTQEKLIPSPTQQPLSRQEVEQKLTALRSAMSQTENVIRFNSMASPKAKGETFPWRLQVPMRNDQLMVLLRSLCHHSVWLLVAGRLKPQGLQRSRLAQDLHDATMGRSSR